MTGLSESDQDFSDAFDAGDVPLGAFDHRAHLRLAYIHHVRFGPTAAASTFRRALQAYLAHHRIDPAKYHETLTQAWLQAVWHFMQRVGPTPDADAFLARSTVLHDARVMMSHYSKTRLFSPEARVAFIAPDLDPIPTGAGSP